MCPTENITTNNQTNHDPNTTFSENEPEVKSAAKREQWNPTFHPVTPYHDVYEITELRRFWHELKSQYIADPDHNLAAFHVLDRNRSHTKHAGTSTLEQVKEAKNRIRVANELVAQLRHIVEPAQTSLGPNQHINHEAESLAYMAKRTNKYTGVRIQNGARGNNEGDQINAVSFIAQVTPSMFQLSVSEIVSTRNDVTQDMDQENQANAAK